MRGFDDFPILLETYRDCLRDVMDLDGLTEVLDRIQRGEIRVGVRESEVPSPVAMGLDYRMAMQYVYEYDAPRGERQLAALSLNRTLLADLLQDGTLAELLKPDAVAEVTARVERTAPEGRARSTEELAQLLYELGDLSDAEVAARCLPEAEGGAWRTWTRDLAAAGRLVPRVLGGERRWVHAERLAEYDALRRNPLPVLRRRLMHERPDDRRRPGPPLRAGRGGGDRDAADPGRGRRLRALHRRRRRAGGGPGAVDRPAHPGADAPAHPDPAPPGGAAGPARGLRRASCAAGRGSETARGRRGQRSRTGSRTGRADGAGRRRAGAGRGAATAGAAASR